MSDDEAVPAAIVIQTCNALVTGATISEDQLRAAMRHYAALVQLLRVSGPSFSQAMLMAVEFHNKAVRRLREGADERRARERRAREAAEGLTELSVE